MLTRRLTLRKEALAPLSDGELREVAGGDGPTISCIPCLVIVTTRIADQVSLLYPTECCAGTGR